MTNRQKARLMIAKRIDGISGLHIDDLPDTSELCEIIDAVEEMLDCKEDPAKFIKNVIDYSFIQDQVYS